MTLPSGSTCCTMAPKAGAAVLATVAAGVAKPGSTVDATVAATTGAVAEAVAVSVGVAVALGATTAVTVLNTVSAQAGCVPTKATAAPATLSRPAPATTRNFTLPLLE